MVTEGSQQPLLWEQPTASDRAGMREGARLAGPSSNRRRARKASRTTFLVKIDVIEVSNLACFVFP